MADPLVFHYKDLSNTIKLTWAQMNQNLRSIEEGVIIVQDAEYNTAQLENSTALLKGEAVAAKEGAEQFKNAAELAAINAGRSENAASESADRAAVIADFDGVHNTLLERNSDNAHNADAISYQDGSVGDALRMKPDHVSGILELIDNETYRVEGTSVLIVSYHKEGATGGGFYSWQPSANKNQHNGGTIIDPNRPFPETWGDNQETKDWFSSGSGVGCFVLINAESATMANFGFKGNGDDSIIFEAVAKADASSVVSISSDVDGGGQGIASISNGYTVGDGTPRFTIDRVPNDEQIDFVEMLRSYKPIVNQLRVYDDGKAHVMCIYGNGRFVQYYLEPQPNTYMTQGVIYTGEWKKDTSFEEGIKADKGTYTGTWIESTDVINGYTTTPGSSYEIEYTVDRSGMSLLFRNNARNDGGTFDYEVKRGGELVATGVIDTYSPTTRKEVTTLLKDATIGAYTVNLVFTGDAGTRGWLTSNATNIIMSAQEVYAVATSEFMTTPSNKDFAIEIAPVENPTGFEFVPAHSGVVTEFNLKPIKWLLDDKEIDVQSLPKHTTLFFENLKVAQEFDFKTPTTSPARALGTVHAVQEINEWGELVMFGALTPNEPIVVGNAYTMMHVGRVESTIEYITGIGNRFAVTVPTQTTRTSMQLEADTTFNFCYVGKTAGTELVNMCSAMRIDNPQETRRLGKSHKDAKRNMTYMQTRSNSIVKLYSHLFVKGTIIDRPIKWSGRFKYVNSDSLDVTIRSF